MTTSFDFDDQLNSTTINSVWDYNDGSAVDSNVTVIYADFNDWAEDYGGDINSTGIECFARGIEYSPDRTMKRQLYEMDRGVLWMPEDQYLDLSGLVFLNESALVGFPSLDSTSCGEFDFEFWDLSCGDAAAWVDSDMDAVPTSAPTAPIDTGTDTSTSTTTSTSTETDAPTAAPTDTSTETDAPTAAPTAATDTSTETDAPTDEPTDSSINTSTTQISTSTSYTSTSTNTVTTWSVGVSATFSDLSVDDWNDELAELFIDGLAASFGVDGNRIHIISVTEGSVVVEADVAGFETVEAAESFVATAEVVTTVFAEELGIVSTEFSEPVAVIHQSSQTDGNNPTLILDSAPVRSVDMMILATAAVVFFA